MGGVYFGGGYFALYSLFGAVIDFPVPKAVEAHNAEAAFPLASNVTLAVPMAQNVTVVIVSGSDPSFTPDE